ALAMCATSWASTLRQSSASSAHKSGYPTMITLRDGPTNQRRRPLADALNFVSTMTWCTVVPSRRARSSMALKSFGASSRVSSFPTTGSLFTQHASATEPNRTSAVGTSNSRKWGSWTRVSHCPMSHPPTSMPASTTTIYRNPSATTASAMTRVVRGLAVVTSSSCAIAVTRSVFMPEKGPVLADVIPAGCSCLTLRSRPRNGASLPKIHEGRRRATRLPLGDQSAPDNQRDRTALGSCVSRTGRCLPVRRAFADGSCSWGCVRDAYLLQERAEVRLGVGDGNFLHPHHSRHFDVTHQVR